LRVTGGLRFVPSSPCSGSIVRGATVDASKVYMAFRYASDQSIEWMDLGLGLAGSNGIPNLRANGSMSAGSKLTLNLSSARPSSPGFLIIGGSPTFLPFLGGTLVPAADVVLFGLGTDGRGGLTLGSTWPSGFPRNLSLYLQMWVADFSTMFGGSASNALLGVTH
jgi:hypothetical protein